jgi:transposase
MERTITLTQGQLRKLQVIDRYRSKVITRKKAAELLDLTERQVTRLKKGIETEGATFVINKNTGKTPAHAITAEMKERILKIRAEPAFQQSNFTHFREILECDYQIILSYTALRSILKEAGIESPKSKRQRKRGKKRRERKEHPGELLQIDATPYEWFGTPLKYTLHGAIDDASGKITGLYMTQNECLFGYEEMMRCCCLKFGVPQSIYSDKHTIFRSPKTGKLTVEEEIQGKTVNLTQFGRAMHELGVDLIYANSPEAKGRVERMWQTLQSRLPVEFAKHGITTVSAANKFLQEEYIDMFNERFAVTPAGESIFVPVSTASALDDILCIKVQRKTDKTGVFSFKGKVFQLLKDGKPFSLPKKEITLLIGPRTGMRAQYQTFVYSVRRCEPSEVPVKSKPEKKVSAVKEKRAEAVSPHLKHSSDEWKAIWWFEDYNETLLFLYDLFFSKQQASRQ